MFKVPCVPFGTSASALDLTLRRSRGAQPALPLQEREPCGEDGEGRGGRVGVPFCAVRQSCPLPLLSPHVSRPSLQIFRVHRHFHQCSRQNHRYRHRALCAAACTALRNVAAAGSNPVVAHIEAAIDNADEDDELPLAPWH